MYSITEEDVNIRFSRILKVNVFSRPEQNYMDESISIENISFSRNCDIKSTKSVTNASVWLKFMSKDSNTDVIEHSLLKGLFRPDESAQFDGVKHNALVL